jgi:hypothetical protein
MNKHLIAAAQSAWSSAAELRAKRLRYKRYTYGDQWGDIVSDGNGHHVREGDLVAQAGRQPLTNNLIRRLVKTIVGRYRNTTAENHRYNNTPGSVDERNALDELDSRLLEEFLISGCAIQRVVNEVRPSVGEGVWIDNVNPCNFFINDFRDPRGTDVEMVGMLHDMSLHEVLARFGNGDRRRMEWLRGLYGTVDPLMAAITGDDIDFYVARNGRCRVVEMWTLEAIESGTRRRASIDFKWRCRWLTPSGDLLATYMSPIGTHPFVVKYYPLTDGEVHPFVEDVIDQQRYINRLIVLIDRMMGASAKGVLLFPVDQKLPGFSWEEVCRRWSAADGVIPIAGRSTTLPQQVAGTGADAGAHKLLEIELKLFEDVSGVSDALMGKTVAGNVGNTVYQTQIANSTIALADIFDTFNAFTAKRDSLAKLLLDYGS